jgi:hypothetical protein
MPRAVRIAAYVAALTALAACSAIPTGPASPKCNPKPGSACVNPDYVNPHVDYVNPHV